MKNLLLALLFTFPLITNASVIKADSFKVELPTLFSEVTEEKSEGRTSWSFGSKHGTFIVIEGQCAGCLVSTQSSVTELLDDPDYSGYGAVLLNVSGQDGLLVYVPTRKQVMLASAEFMREDRKITVQLVTRLGLKPAEVQMANVELMRLLNAIEFN
ncbi:hypothetical protein VINI7043_10971 [Vibrio nigripulchritudo ATCC 27043]|uniref:hypothetical protein n=1 Tax=Vibrio nigripulchritudo TaxID=28173 RepID=UPI00021C1C42|nr:hypothetical protein [Vibrio nigripulchritudo]EGU55630.1 hypothetical protein VINI7043_10971 [Vibrio nigripulchritudo ATCC 27043]